MKIRIYQVRMRRTMDQYIENLDARDFLAVVEQLKVINPQHKELHDGFDVLIYIRTSLKDIFLVYKVFFTCNDPEEKNLHARTLANHIWEFIRKVEKQINQPLEVFTKVWKSHAVLAHLANIRLYYKMVYEKLDIMAEIRHNASAHKDKDVTKQLKIIDNIKDDDFNITMVWLQCIAVSIVQFERSLYKEVVDGKSQKKST